MDAIDWLYMDESLRVIGLHVVRVTALFLPLPIFGQGSASRFGRMALGMMLGITVAYARGIDPIDDPGADAVAFGLAVGREFLLGALMGWTIGLVFDSVRIAGGLIATEMGLTLASQFDPLSNSQQSIIAILLVNASFVLYFTMDGHIMTLTALLQSFEVIPPGQLGTLAGIGPTLVEITSVMVDMGVRIAAPVWFILIITTICVGFLAKVAQQLNVLEASWPIRISVALLLLTLFAGPVLRAFRWSLIAVHQGVDALLMEIA